MERGSAEDAEAAVDESPGEGSATDRSGDEGERNDCDAGDEAERYHPLVANWIKKRPDEDDGDDEVCKGAPVGSVSEEWIVRIGRSESLEDSQKPRRESAANGVALLRMEMTTESSLSRGKG